MDIDEAPTYDQMVGHVRMGEPVDMAIIDARSGEMMLIADAVIAATADPDRASRGFFGVSADFPNRGLPPLQAAAGAAGLSARIAEAVFFALPDLVTDGLGGAADSLLNGDPPPASDAASDDPGSGSAEPVGSVLAAGAGSESAASFEARRVAGSTIDQNRVLSVIGVARLGTELAASDGTEVLVLVAAVNLFLGMFNLLPLPPLDGGHAAAATYERLRRIGGRSYRVDPSHLMPVAYAVVGLLVLIGGLALVRDIIDPLTIG